MERAKVKCTMTDAELDAVCRDYCKAYLYASLFIFHHERATETMLQKGYFNKDLIGKHREVERAFDRYQEAVRKLITNPNDVGTDYDKFKPIFDGILDGKITIKDFAQ